VDLLEPLIGSASSPNLLLQTGKRYFRNLLYRQAVVPLKRAWDLSKSYENGMFLALTYYQLGQYANCSPVVEQIIPNAGEALEYHILKGSALARLGEWDKSRRELEQAVASADDRADGYFNLRLFWMERGDRQKAWELLEKALGA
jgi:tetratricopeptide (TPR) repeat protein